VADWPRLLGLVDKALDLPPSARAAWLQVLALPSALDAALRRLLAERAELEREYFLQALPAITAAAPAQHVAMQPGANVGPWRLVSLLGEGGMSAVWLAERSDGLLQRQVALKMPHAGPGQELLVERMLRERKILAALNHPHIARLYDVGVAASGVPYMVMEHVAGSTLLAHADTRQLDLTRRLALFQQVLAAVQHAHGQLVLHRDIKPSNILVAADGDVKLLDFGIAKLLHNTAAEGADQAVNVGDGSQASHAHTDLTRHTGHRLTPAYASPEQLAGQTLGVASDVYSLGVVLYELLCGCRPHAAQSSSQALMEAAVLHGDPVAPSRAAITECIARQRESAPRGLAKRLRGDLDAIVLRALAHAPQDRYASAADLAADIQRFTEGLPVMARAPGLLYHASRFVRRHRLPVAVLGLALSLVLGAAAVAVAEGRAARLQAERAATARDFLLELFAGAAPDRLGGIELTATQLLEQGRQMAAFKLANQPRLQAELLAGIGQTQQQMNDLAGADAAFAAAAVTFQHLGDRTAEAGARLARIAVAEQEEQFRLMASQIAELRPLLPMIEAQSLLRLQLSCASGRVRLDTQSALADNHTQLLHCAEQADLDDPRQVALAFRARTDLSAYLAEKGQHAAANAQLEMAECMPTDALALTADMKAVALGHARAKLDAFADRWQQVMGWLPAAITACDRQYGAASKRCGELQRMRLWALLRLGQVQQADSLASAFMPAMLQTRDRERRFHGAYVLVRLLAGAAPSAHKSLALQTLTELVQQQEPAPLELRLRLPALGALIVAELREGNVAGAQRWAQQGESGLAALPAGQWAGQAQYLRNAIALAHQARGEHAGALQAFGSTCIPSAALDDRKSMPISLVSLDCVPSLLARGKPAQALALAEQALPVLLASLGPSAPHTQRAAALLQGLRAPGGQAAAPWSAGNIFLR
jgi:serine/threonine protein kinase